MQFYFVWLLDPVAPALFYFHTVVSYCPPQALPFWSQQCARHFILFSQWRYLFHQTVYLSFCRLISVSFDNVSVTKSLEHSLGVFFVWLLSYHLPLSFVSNAS